MINYKLDIKDGIEIENLVGEITILTENNSIVLHDTYIDSIFEALLEGVSQLRNKNKASIELIEEPGSIEFELIDNKIALSYQKKTLYLDSADFLKNLLITLDSFLKAIKNMSGEKDNKIISHLKMLKERISLESRFES